METITTFAIMNCAKSRLTHFLFSSKLVSLYLMLAAFALRYLSPNRSLKIFRTVLWLGMRNYFSLAWSLETTDLVVTRGKSISLTTSFICSRRSVLLSNRFHPNLNCCIFSLILILRLSIWMVFTLTPTILLICLGFRPLNSGICWLTSKSILTYSSFSYVFCSLRRGIRVLFSLWLLLSHYEIYCFILACEQSGSYLNNLVSRMSTHFGLFLLFSECCAFIACICPSRKAIRSLSGVSSLISRSLLT